MHHLPAEREHDETNDAGVKTIARRASLRVRILTLTVRTARFILRRGSRGRNLSGTLRSGTIPATLSHVNVQVNLPDELVARIDDLSTDRSEFVAEAVRRALRESDQKVDEQETARINEVVDELNREAEDVLEYQVLT